MRKSKALFKTISEEEEEDPAVMEMKPPTGRLHRDGSIPPFVPLVDLTSPLPTLPDLNGNLRKLIAETSTPLNGEEGGGATASSSSSSSSSSSGAVGDAGLGLDFDGLDAGLESMLEELTTLDAALASEETKVRSACEEAEVRFRDTVSGLGGGMELALKQHAGMGERYQRVGWRARQMGGELAAAEAQRLRSAECLELLSELDKLARLPLVKARAAQLQRQQQQQQRGGGGGGAAKGGGLGGAGWGGPEGRGGDEGGGEGEDGGVDHADAVFELRDEFPELEQCDDFALLKTVGGRLFSLHTLTCGLEERHPEHAAAALAVKMSCQVAKEALLERFDREWKSLAPRRPPPALQLQHDVSEGQLQLGPFQVHTKKVWSLKEVSNGDDGGDDSDDSDGSSSSDDDDDDDDDSDSGEDGDGCGGGQDEGNGDQDGEEPAEEDDEKGEDEEVELGGSGGKSLNSKTTQAKPSDYDNSGDGGGGGGDDDDLAELPTLSPENKAKNKSKHKKKTEAQAKKEAKKLEKKRKASEVARKQAKEAEAKAKADRKEGRLQEKKEAKERKRQAKREAKKKKREAEGGGDDGEGWPKESLVKLKHLRQWAHALDKVHPTSGRPLQKRFVSAVLAKVHTLAAAASSTSSSSSSAFSAGTTYAADDAAEAASALSALITAITGTCETEFLVAARAFPAPRVFGVLTALVDRLVHDQDLGFEARASDLLKPLALQARTAGSILRRAGSSSSFDGVRRREPGDEFLDNIADENEEGEDGGGGGVGSFSSSSSPRQSSEAALSDMEEYLDTLCFVQAKASSLFQLVDDHARRSLEACSKRADAQAAKDKATGANNAHAAAVGKGRNVKRKSSHHHHHHHHQKSSVKAKEEGGDGEGGKGLAGAAATAATGAGARRKAAVAKQWGEAAAASSARDLFTQFTRHYARQELLCLRASCVAVVANACTRHPDIIAFSAPDPSDPDDDDDNDGGDDSGVELGGGGSGSGVSGVSGGAGAAGMRRSFQRSLSGKLGKTPVQLGGGLSGSGGSSGSGGGGGGGPTAGGSGGGGGLLDRGLDPLGLNRQGVSRGVMGALTRRKSFAGSLMGGHGLGATVSLRSVKASDLGVGQQAWASVLEDQVTSMEQLVGSGEVSGLLSGRCVNEVAGAAMASLRRCAVVLGSGDSNADGRHQCECALGLFARSSALLAEGLLVPSLHAASRLLAEASTATTTATAATDGSSSCNGGGGCIGGGGFRSNFLSSTTAAASAPTGGAGPSYSSWSSQGQQQTPQERLTELLASLECPPPPAQAFYRLLSQVSFHGLNKLHELHNGGLPHTALKAQPALRNLGHQTLATHLASVERAGLFATRACVEAACEVVGRALSKQHAKTHYCPRSTAAGGAAGGGKEAKGLSGSSHGSGSGAAAAGTAAPAAGGGFKGLLSRSASSVASSSKPTTAAAAAAATATTKKQTDGGDLEDDEDEGGDDEVGFFDEAEGASGRASPAFTVAALVVKTQAELAAKFLPRKDAAALTLALVARVHALVVRHLKSLRVSPVGAVALLRDLDDLHHAIAQAAEGAAAAVTAAGAPKNDMPERGGGGGGGGGSVAQQSSHDGDLGVSSFERVGEEHARRDGTATAAQTGPPSCARPAAEATAVAVAARALVGAFASLRDAAAVLLVPPKQLPEIVDRLCVPPLPTPHGRSFSSASGSASSSFSSSSSASSSSSMPPSSEKDHIAAGPSPSAEAGKRAVVEHARRAFLMELLACRSDYWKDATFGRRAVWVKELFPDSAS